MYKEETIAVTEFKAKCLSLLDSLGPSGLVITKHGRPIAKVLPVTRQENERLIGSMREKIKVRGDLFSTELQWNAESRHPYRRGSPKRRS